MSSFRSFACASLVLGFVVGCGGSSDSGGGTTGDSGSPSDTSGGGDTNKTDTTTGTDTSTTDTHGGTDTTTGTDTTPPPPSDSGVTCGAITCDKGQVCCATPGDGGATFTCAATSADCPDGGVAIACAGGKDCSGGTPYCCGTVTLDPSTPPCGFSAGSASCAAACQTDIPLSCSGTHKARLCDAPSDCTDDTGYTNCCTFTGGGTSGTICANDTMKAFADSCL